MNGHLATDLARLGQTFAGDIITPGDARYDGARRVWNGMIDRRPAAVLRPTSPPEVAAAVKLSREHDVALAVRCGGHSLPGLSTCDDGIVIDLSRMRGVTVDAARRTARANGGACSQNSTPLRRPWAWSARWESSATPAWVA